MHDVDDIMFPFGSELFTRCIDDTEDISSELDRHDLRSETDSEVGNIFHAGILGRHDHPLRSTRSESSWYTDPIESIQHPDTIFLDIFCFDELEFYFFLVSISSRTKSLIERVVGIFESDIFPDHRDTEDIIRRFDIREELFPFRHIWGSGRETKCREDLFSEIV